MLDYSNIYIGGIEPISFSDFPGGISTVIFLCGCNFRCPTCHNKEIAWDYSNIDEVPLQEIIKTIDSYKDYIDAITISGGEPTIYENLPDFIDLLKSKYNVKIKLDSNGSNLSRIMEVIEKVDNLSLDIKGPFHKYPILTGNSFSREEAKNNFYEFFELTRKYPGKIKFRTTKVPYLTESDLEEVNEYVEKFSLSHVFQQYVQIN